MVRAVRAGIIIALALGLVLPCSLFGESAGYPMYDYPGLNVMPTSPNPDDEELSGRVKKALDVWTKEKFPGQGRMVHKTIVVGLDLYLVMSMWWSDMGFSTRLNKTQALWGFWADYYLKEGPKYENIVLGKKDMRVFLLDRKGRTLGGSHRGREVSAWAAQ